MLGVKISVLKNNDFFLIMEVFSFFTAIFILFNRDELQINTFDSKI